MKNKFLLFAAAAFLFSPAIVKADDHTGHSGDDMEHASKMHSKKERFAKVDQDQDGFISKSEFLARHEEKFNKMDENGDGKLSIEEMEAVREKYKEKMKERVQKRMDHRKQRQAEEAEAATE